MIAHHLIALVSLVFCDVNEELSYTGQRCERGPFCHLKCKQSQKQVRTNLFGLGQILSKQVKLQLRKCRWTIRIPMPLGTPRNILAIVAFSLRIYTQPEVPRKNTLRFTSLRC